MSGFRKQMMIASLLQAGTDVNNGLNALSRHSYNSYKFEDEIEKIIGDLTNISERLGEVYRKILETQS
jgi:hypothetical protein